MILSVIIPCYNAEDTIEAQLNALANQSWSGTWELLVADNGSIDGTLQIVDKYKEKIPNLTILDASDKKGPAHARNIAAKSAMGKYLLFCDADDEVSLTWLDEMAKALIKYPIVASKMEHFKLSGAGNAQPGKQMQQDGLMQYSYVPYMPHAGTSGLGIRKELHDRIGGFDQNFLVCEDCDYCWRAQLSGAILFFNANALIHIRHKNNRKSKWLKQAATWGMYNALLVKKFVPLGMPKPTLRTGMNRWRKLINKNQFRIILKNKEGRDKWLWDMSYRFGQLAGCIKFRSFAP